MFVCSLYQSCRQIEIYPEFRSFSGAFLGTYDKNGNFLCVCFFIFLIGSFLGAFLGAFDKYVEIMCYFGSFSKVLVAFGSFLERF